MGRTGHLNIIIMPHSTEVFSLSAKYFLLFFFFLSLPCLRQEVPFAINYVHNAFVLVEILAVVIDKSCLTGSCWLRSGPRMSGILISADFSSTSTASFFLALSLFHSYSSYFITPALPMVVVSI